MGFPYLCQHRKYGGLKDMTNLSLDKLRKGTGAFISESDFQVIQLEYLDYLKEHNLTDTETNAEELDCQHFFRQIFLGYFPCIAQVFDIPRKNVCGDDYTSLHNPIVLSSVLLVCEIFHSTQILF